MEKLIFRVLEKKECDGYNSECVMVIFLLYCKMLI